MKRYFITPLFALAIASGAFAQAPQAADFNRAVMQAYEEMLRENYKDYEVLFRRANEYYNHGDYLRALEDLDSAVKYCPESDSDLRFSIYALRAECYYELKRYAQALPEATAALNIDPTSTAMLNLRGRIEYDFNQLTEAKADFSKLLRINSRSQEALFGLALVAAKENNVGLAGEYME
ncbi:MAG: tetratricopeptide repeat protein, partial [Muribaculaceae bacterium]|nr:tetratricopeptide repeat protein [Muribaculaceae bacterium]